MFIYLYLLNFAGNTLETAYFINCEFKIFYLGDTNIPHFFFKYLPISRVKFISQLIISYNLIRHRSSQSMYVVPHITSDGLVQKLSVIGYLEFVQFSNHEKWTVIFGQLYSSYWTWAEFTWYLTRP